MKLNNLSVDMARSRPSVMVKGEQIAIVKDKRCIWDGDFTLWMQNCNV